MAIKITKVIIIYFILFLCFYLVSGGESFAQQMMESPEEFVSPEEGEEEVSEKGVPTEEKKKVGQKEIVEIKVVEEQEGERLYSMELRNVDLKDFLRIVAHDYDLNIIMEKDVKGKVTASFEKVSLKEALDSILKIHGFKIVKKGNIMRVTKDLITKVFTLQSIEAKKLVNAAGDGGGGQVAGAVGVTGGGAGAGQQAAGGTTGGETTKKVNTILDLLSEDGKILLGKQPNSIMVKDHPENVKFISEYLEMADKGMMTKVFQLKYIRADELLGIKKEEEEEGEEESEEETSQDVGK